MSPVGGVVIDHEHAVQRPQGIGALRRTGTMACLAKRAVNQKRAAFAGLALDADLAAHQLDQLLADGQAEAGAAVPARGGAVGLREALEDAACLLRRDADAGVGDRRSAGSARPRSVSRRAVDATHDLAALGELDGVADEVDQHLAQAAGIADAARRARRARREQASSRPFCWARAARSRPALLDDVAEVEIDALELELAGLDLGEVEDVVDDGRGARRR